MAGGKKSWNLEDLVDFEVAVVQSPSVDSEQGRRIREGLRDQTGTEMLRRRWALKEWLIGKQRGSGAKVEAVTRFMGLFLFVGACLIGIGGIRGLVTEVSGQKALNIWLLLAGTLGVQWLLLIGGLVTFLLMRYWIGGLGWFKDCLAMLVRRFVGRISPEAWRALIQGKGKQPSAMVWRLTRLLQLGGVGFNVGLLIGMFGVLWFTDVRFYWESSLSRFGGESLGQVIRFLGAPWGGGLSDAQLVGLNDVSGSGGDREAFTFFFFKALLVWGFVPRVLLWVVAVLKERRALAKLDFQDLSHRKLWRELSRIERQVTMEGMKDGVVLLDVGGLGLDVAEIRPFLLQQLRVNPEKSFAVGVLDASEEREAWSAIREAPCGVILLVEGWDLSTKLMTTLIGRIRAESGDETVLRVLVLGDGIAVPDEADFEAWQEFIDGLRDPQLECVAYQI